MSSGVMLRLFTVVLILTAAPLNSVRQSFLEMTSCSNIWERIMTCSDASIAIAPLLYSRHRKKSIVSSFMENSNVPWSHAREPLDHTSDRKTSKNIYGSTTKCPFGKLTVCCQGWSMLVIPLLVNVIWRLSCGPGCGIVWSVQSNKREKVSTLRWSKKLPLSLSALWGYWFHNYTKP